MEFRKKHCKYIIVFSLAILVCACSQDSSFQDTSAATSEQETDDSTTQTGTEDPTTPVTPPTEETLAPLAKLGMKLFFSKSLGGDKDSACVSCHHPVLGGTDNLSLPVGVGAITPDLLGSGRMHKDGLPLVPRNTPSIFNIALWDKGLFWDSRVESIGKEPGANGSLSEIRTPDSDYLFTDADAGDNLVAAQARFPVTSIDEMRGADFEADMDNTAVRDHLAARIGNYGVGTDELVTNNWLSEFQIAFESIDDAQTLITFENIAFALGEYQRSMLFSNNTWARFNAGDNSALTEDQQAGARLFFDAPQNGGAGCAGCHNGPLFSDEQHHNIAFPHIGPGKGDGNNDDFGRERETGLIEDRYKFRTPSLLNIANTAPYGHTGSFQTLEAVVRHYINPNNSLNQFFQENGACQLPQFNPIENCDELYPDNQNNSQLALDKLNEDIRNGTSVFRPIRLNNIQVSQLVSFLEALTDPCIEDRECIAKWIPNSTDLGPDEQQLNAIDKEGSLL
jgi:cytochrome c peroxidase